MMFGGKTPPDPLVTIVSPSAISTWLGMFSNSAVFGSMPPHLHCPKYELFFNRALMSELPWIMGMIDE